MNGGNSGFLVQECGWSGLMVDADRARSTTVKVRYAGHAVTSNKQRVTTRERQRACSRCTASRGELDFLSIDIDGNDYWVWEALTACSPRVVALEYNWLFGPERAVTIPYDPSSASTRSGRVRYRGASLAALAHLATAQGLSPGRDRASECVLPPRTTWRRAIPAIEVARGYRAPKEMGVR